MLRIHGRISLAATLVAAGLVNGEPQAAKSAKSENVMTLTSENGKPRRCQILKTSKHPSGGIAYEVKADDGEVFTVVENASTEKVVSLLPEAKTSVGQVKAVATDPILQPGEYTTSPKIQEQIGVESVKSVKTIVNYDKAPQPMMSRWFSSKKESTPVVLPALAPVVVVEPVRHSDPVVRMIGGLREEMLPSLREYAAESLATGPGRNRADVVDALISAAKHDPAPSVRACCARCLAELNVGSPACVAALNSMKSDEDESVRTAASAALSRIKH